MYSANNKDDRAAAIVHNGYGESQGESPAISGVIRDETARTAGRNAKRVYFRAILSISDKRERGRERERRAENKVKKREREKKERGRGKERMRKKSRRSVNAIANVTNVSAFLT